MSLVFLGNSIPFSPPTHFAPSQRSDQSVSYSTQPPPAYSHPSTATYSIQQAPTVPHAVTASYSPATVQAAQPVVSAPYAGYQSHQPPQDYTYRPADPPAAPHPTTTPQTYQPDNYNYARPAVVTTYDNKQYYQTSIVSAQRSTTDNYYQTGETFLHTKKLI
uniref:Uncharacterized protein n=1 Tax=Hippocampus comes TaxID=109280 RepID=A0A3Q2Y220_HIPCM